MTMSNLPPIAKPLDFEKIEALRKHMLLTVGSMAELLKTSRVNYYAWVKGQKQRKPEEIRATVRKMVELVAANSWPNANVFGADQATKVIMLREAIADLDKKDEQQ
jgi:predicted transcriptional regulator